MRTLCALSLAVLALSGCGTSTEEKYSRDPMPEIGNYPPTPQPWTRVRVAINKFQDKTKGGYNKPDGGQAAEQMETLVIRSKRFNTIERLQLENLLKEQGLEGVVDPAELAKPGKVRGVDYLILGAITNFRVKIVKTGTSGGVFSALKVLAPVDIDTSKTVISTEVGVDVKLVNTTTGEIVSKDFGEVKREDVASAWGVKVLGIGGDAKNEMRIDQDAMGKIMRWALDESYKQMLPDIDEKFSKAQPSYCPHCKTEVPGNQNFCTKCGKSIVKAKCAKCSEILEPGAKFCAGCGTKTEAPK